MGIVILAVVLAVILIWVIVSSQRNLVSKEELCGNALSQIGVQQTSRWDALSTLADLTKAYSEHEYKSMMDIIGQRKPVTVSSTTQDAQQQEDMISQAMTKFMAITESYPELKANTIYTKTMASVEKFEDDVRMSRMVYNDTVTGFNRLVRQIPTCFVASIFGFAKKEYLATEDAKTQMPKMV